MTPDPSLRFTIASSASEFEGVHRLNYQTFVEEIPQHQRNAEQRLVDKFHGENTYAIAVSGDTVVGMIAGRGARPFSLDQKVADLDAHLPEGHRVLEVRLLSVTRPFRNGFVFSRLVRLLAQHFREAGYDLAIISGTTRQLKLYSHLGFVPFGPMVGESGAQFQPMYLTLESFIQMGNALATPSDAVETILANFLPGPVDVHDDVRRAFERSPVSHRSQAFMADFRSTKRMLCALVGAQSVEVLLGSGSLANDAVCGQLSLLDAHGIILSNGEFGERLIDHATRQGLSCEVSRAPWGAPYDLVALRTRLEANPAIRWLWAVHCETSTGVLNDLPALKALCAERQIKLCLDCISSIGTVPILLDDVYLASCVSGKALASFPGLSMVFYNHELRSAPGLARYLDLGLYAAQAGIPFTTSSNLVYALQSALSRTNWQEKYQQIADVSVWLRRSLREAGLPIVAADADASPAVVSIALPSRVSSRMVGKRLKDAGFLLSFGSEYLLQRNWIQICLMGEWSREQLETLPARIAGLCAETPLERPPRVPVVA